MGEILYPVIFQKYFAKSVQLITVHCQKSNPNFRDITLNVEKNLILHELFHVVSGFPRYISCYIAESRFPLGQCCAVSIRPKLFQQLIVAILYPLPKLPSDRRVGGPLYFVYMCHVKLVVVETISPILFSLSARRFYSIHSHSACPQGFSL